MAELSRAQLEHARARIESTIASGTIVDYEAEPQKLLEAVWWIHELTEQAPALIALGEPRRGALYLMATAHMMSLVTHRYQQITEPVE